MSERQDLAVLVATFVERSTARQGLPPKLESPELLKDVATAIRVLKGGNRHVERESA